MGDTWWRRIDSQIYGPLPIGNVIGRVQGYEKNNGILISQANGTP